MDAKYFKFEVYVPLTHVDVVKDAMCKAGAGKYGSYDSCCWTTNGIGQFRPLDGANPFIGKVNEIEKVEEAKIECMIEAGLVKNLISEMKKAHPYEVPAYHYWPIFID